MKIAALIGAFALTIIYAACYLAPECSLGQHSMHLAGMLMAGCDR